MFTFQEPPITETLASLFLASMFLVLCVGGVLLIVWIITVISQWRIYTKAGQPGWASIIPIYSTLVMLDIIRKPRIWLLYIVGIAVVQAVINTMYTTSDGTTDYPVLVAIVMIVLSITLTVLSVRITHGLSLAFGKNGWFTVGLIFLPIVFFPILGFGSAQYQYHSYTMTSTTPNSW
jgi:hypothetical protein